MCFRREAEMSAAVQAWLESMSMEVRREFRLPWGYCDLVGCSLHGQRARRRLRQGQVAPIRHALALDVFLCLPSPESGPGKTLSDLVGVYRGTLNERVLAEAVEWLLGSGYAKGAPCTGLWSIDGWLPLHRRLVAVEMKLDRVAEALAQAQSNLGFATESYVALPSPVCGRLRASGALAEFRAAGIGLLAVSDAGCRVLARAERNVPSMAFAQARCAETFWPEWVTGNSA